MIRIVAGSADIDQSYNTDYKSIEIKNFNGRDGGIYVNGFLIYTCVVVCMQMKIAYMTNVWTWIHWICWLASTAGFLLFAWSYSQFGDIYDWYKVVDFAMGTSLFYLGVLVIVWLMYIVHQVLQSASAHFFPSSQDRLRALADLNCSDSEVGEIKKHTRFFRFEILF